MEKYWATAQAWVWPLAVSLLVLTGFVIRGSDTPPAALFLCALFALAAAIVCLVPLPEHPVLFQRPVVGRAAIALGLFLAAVGLPMAIEAFQPPHGFALYDPSAALVECLKLGGVACAFLLGLRLSASDDQARRLFDALLYAGGIWATASIFMFILDPAGIYGMEKFGAGRLTGAFSSPNSAGTLFGALMVMALGRVISRLLTRREAHILERIDPIMTGVFAVSAAALMLTVSRGAFVATLISAITLCLLLARGRVSMRVLAGIGGAGLLAMAILFAIPIAGIMARLDGLDGDAAVRATILKAHFAFAVHQPLFGAGLGAFNTVNTHIVSAADYPALSVIRAMHNVYLQWFEETGAVGLLSLIALNLAILMPMVAAARRRALMGGRIWAIIGGYAVFLLHGFVDYAFQEPALALFAALLLGCGFGMAGNHTEKPARKAVCLKK